MILGESLIITYTHRCPCLTCGIKISQVGISEVVYSQSYSMDHDVSTCSKYGKQGADIISQDRGSLSGSGSKTKTV